MREKILHLMSVSMTPFPEAVNQIIASFRRDLEQADAMTSDRSNALEDYKRALLLKKDARDALIADVYEQNFTEAEIDALIEFQKSDAQPLLEKLGNLAPTLASAGNAWITEVLGEVSVLRDAVNELTIKWVENNTTTEIGMPLPEAPLDTSNATAPSVAFVA